MRHDLDQLIKEHETICGIAERLIAAVCAAPRDLVGILMLRSELAIVLQEHLDKEDSFLYEKSLRQTKGDFIAAIDKFEANYASLTADWQAYLEEWTLDVIAKDLDHFCAVTLEIIARLQARVAHENGLLYPLALQQGRIQLRA